MLQIAPAFEKFVLPWLPVTLAGVRRGAALLLLLAGVPTLSQAETPRAARPAIELEQVVAALNMAMLPLESAVVRLLAQNTATIAEPGLEVRALEPWGDRGARVRLECAAHEQCLPFYVAIDWADSARARAALHAATLGTSGAARKTQPTQPSAEAGGGTAKVAPATASSRIAAQGSNVEAAANLHAGSHATLLIDGQRVHIKVPVICLENGGPGRTIRVTALDHKQTYRAEIVDGTLLKTTL